MAEETTATVAKRNPNTVKSIVMMPEYRVRFDEVLGSRSAAFIGALTALAAQKGLAECEPRSVIAAAFQAATLDLPIEKNLGFAWVVPYKGVGQFQMGWRGLVQLALRSGQYRRMNAFKVNAAAYVGLDDFAEARLDFSKLDETEPAVGFAIAWELLNGFKKVVYWPKKKCLDHAKRYSQSFKAAGGTPWQTHEDEMCLKTVVSNGLKAWGALSVQMQHALQSDQTARMDIDAEPVYIDAVPIESAPAEAPSGKSQAEKIAGRIKKAKAEPSEAQPEPQEAPVPAPEAPPADDGKVQEVIDALHELGEALGYKPEFIASKIKAATDAGVPGLTSLAASWTEMVKAVGKK